MSQDSPPSLLATLAFLDLFKVPLEQSKREQLELTSRFQCRPRTIIERDGALSFHAEDAFWKKWKARKQRQSVLLQKARRWAWLFALCPFVRFAAVCNSVAIGDVEEDSDIDLFIITKARRLFLTRLLLTGLTQIFGIRRHGKKIQGRFCLSFYATEDALNLDLIALKPQDIYLAFWFRTLIPLTGSLLTYAEFMEANAQWLSRYFKGVAPNNAPFHSIQYFQNSMEALLDWHFLEAWAKGLQWKRMQKKCRALKDSSGTVLSDQMLKFHDEDQRQPILEEWRMKTKGKIQ